MSASIPANEFVTDTMGLILRIEGRKLSLRARSIFDSVETGSAVVYVPAMVFAEILYLSEKKRISISLKEVEEHFNKHPNYKEFPITLEVVQTTSQITDIAELHDRLIAGTARLLGLSLITSDSILQASSFVKTVW